MIGAPRGDVQAREAVEWVQSSWRQASPLVRQQMAKDLRLLADAMEPKPDKWIEGPRR